MTSVLRERYTKLLRWYPAADRADRGVEIVDTYMDLAREGQRWPRPGDVVDLIVGGLRQRLRARNALGLADALPIAGTLALMMATVLAAVWMTGMVTTLYGYQIYETAGPFNILGALVWTSWLVAPLAALVGYGRWAVAVAVIVTAAMVPPAAFTGLDLSPLSVLLPQIALGMVALAAPPRRGYWGTAVIFAPAAAAAVLAVLVGPQSEGLSAGGLILGLAAIVTGVVLTVRHDRRAWWPAVVLLGPVLVLNSHLAFSLIRIPLESRRFILAWTMMSLLVAVAALVIAVTWQTKRAWHQTAVYE